MAVKHSGSGSSCSSRPGGQAVMPRFCRGLGGVFYVKDRPAPSPGLCAEARVAVPIRPVNLRVSYVANEVNNRSG